MPKTSLSVSTSGPTTAALSECAAHQHLERPLGQDAGVDDDARDALGDAGCGGPRLLEHRDSRQQRAGRLLEHAPGREVERVDVHGDAAACDPDVLPLEVRGAAELQRVAVGQERPVGEGLREVRVGRQRGGRPVHVELGVAARVAGVGDADVDELLAVLVDGRAQGLERRAALRERQRPQRGAAHVARVLQRRSEVQPLAARVGDGLLGGGVDEWRSGALPGAPRPGQVARQVAHSWLLGGHARAVRARTDRAPYQPGARRL
jgi:hypothetical protein